MSILCWLSPCRAIYRVKFLCLRDFTVTNLENISEEEIADGKKLSSRHSSSISEANLLTSYSEISVKVVISKHISSIFKKLLVGKMCYINMQKDLTGEDSSKQAPQRRLAYISGFSSIVKSLCCLKISSSPGLDCGVTSFSSTTG
jgi:hypothetical protein